MAYSRPRRSLVDGPAFLSDSVVPRTDGFTDGPVTVTTLTQCVKTLIGNVFSHVCVVGEVSGLSVQRAGHAYFTLKDSGAQLPAVMWGGTYSRYGNLLSNGIQVVCFGRLDVYLNQGRYQLYVDRVEPVGIGELSQRRSELFQKLKAEGLFQDSRRKGLPLFIKRVGVVTSPTGAALRDFLNILRGFSKCVEVVVAPTRVQGVGAGSEIASAIRRLDSLGETLGLDAIAVIRGGGSVEDLWEFNEEVVVRAVVASRLPIVTGIGHEIDTQLCDLAADIQAPTPTAAADEIVTCNKEFFLQLSLWKDKMRSLIERNCQKAYERLTALEKRPVFHEPRKVIGDRRIERLTQLERRLNLGVESVMHRHDSLFREMVGKLEALSPLAVLNRGYSITRDAYSTQILRSTDDVTPGKTIETRLADGIVRSLVIESERQTND